MARTKQEEAKKKKKKSFVVACCFVLVVSGVFFRQEPLVGFLPFLVMGERFFLAMPLGMQELTEIPGTDSKLARPNTYEGKPSMFSPGPIPLTALNTMSVDRRRKGSATSLMSPEGKVGGGGKRPQPQTLSFGSPILLPKINKFRDKNADYFETPTPHKKPRRGIKATGKTAWGTADDLTGNDSDGSAGSYKLAQDAYSNQKDMKKRNRMKATPVQSVSTALQSVQQALSVQHTNIASQESRQRHHIIKNASHMVQQLPLSYLFSKPELRHYALEQIFHRMLIFAYLREKRMMERAFYVWNHPPVLVCNDRQIGLVVLARGFQQVIFTLI